MRVIAAFFATCLAVAASSPAYAQVANAANQPTAQQNADFLAANKRKKGVIVRPSGLQFRIIRNGFGARPMPTDTVTVYYTGRLINGAIFDGTSAGLPAALQVNRVVPGFMEALLSMRVGDRWELVIPSNLGYGPGGSQIIGPDQTLIFDIELLGTKPAPKRGEKGYVPEPGEEPNR